MATKTVKRPTFQDRAKRVKKIVRDFNKGSIDMSYEIVDEGLAMGTQWQELFAKSLKKSTRIFGKQQELMLTTLEGIKEQLIDNNEKVVKLLELDKLADRINERIDKTIAPAKKLINTQVKRVKEEVDDLSKIKGIGAKTKSILHKAGITSFKDLAEFPPKALIEMLEAAGLKSMIPKVKGWIAQAKKMV